MQTHHKLLIMAIIFSLILLVFGERCAHALSDFAGQGKAPITWDDLMKPREDPSRYFAVPGGGHGDHPAGGYDAPSVAKAESKPESKPTVTPADTPHIPMVPAPKPEVEPEVKPEVKPQPKPEVKPDYKPKPEPEAKEHKCWSFKFKPICTPKVKPECKHESAKPDKKPSCRKGDDHKKSECSKPNHPGPTHSHPGKGSSCGKFGHQKGDKGPGLNGRPNGPSRGNGHKGGLCGRGGVGKGGHGHGCR